MTYDITVGQYDNFGPYLQYLAIVTGHGSAGPYTNNPEVGTLLDKALTESGDELCKTVQDIQKSVLENADFVPLESYRHLRQQGLGLQDQHLSAARSDDPAPGRRLTRGRIHDSYCGPTDSSRSAR